MYKLILLIAALSAVPAPAFGDSAKTAAGRQEVKAGIRDLRQALRAPQVEGSKALTVARLMREDRDRSDRRSDRRERDALHR